MPLTRADILGRKMLNAMHIDYSRQSSAWMGLVEGIPRLGLAKGVEKGTSFTRWYVDEKPVRDLDAALAVLNGEMTLEAAMAEEQKPARKVSLGAQISEVEYELDQRASVYPRIASSHPSRSSELELHTERMKAVLATLQWLRENELDVRAYVKAKKIKKVEAA